MYRTASEKVKEWLISAKKALLITGARQIGKTYLIREEALKKSIIDIDISGL